MCQLLSAAAWLAPAINVDILDYPQARTLRLHAG
jgi:hypothetical protein